MGCTRTTRPKFRVSPVAIRPTPPPNVRLGVESDRDPMLNGGLGGSPLGKTAARHLNNQRLKEALISIAVPKPKPQQKLGYRVTSVDMCIAASREADPSNIGRWFQKEQKEGAKSLAYYPCFLTTMDPTILASDPIARWLIIREELLPTPKGRKHGSSPTPSTSPANTRNLRIASSSRARRRAPSTPPSPANNRNLRIASSSRARHRSPSTLPPSSPPPPSSLPVATSPADPTPPTLLSDTVATILMWTKDGTTPMDLIVHSREDGRIRLSDYKVELGQQECEQMNQLEVYRIHSRRWIPFPTNTPLRLNHAGEMIFFKYAHVKYPDGFISRLQVEHGFGFEPEDEDNDKYYSDSDPGSLVWKGKRRAF